MDLRILHDEQGNITVFYAKGDNIEILPDNTVELIEMESPEEWGCLYTELSPEEVNDVIDVIRTILKERLNNV